MTTPLKIQTNHIATIILLTLTLLLLFLYTPLTTTKFPFQTTKTSPPPSNPNPNSLQTALSTTSTPNKTLIIAVVNKAYVESTTDDQRPLLDLFIESFWVGDNTRELINHLLLVTVDQTSFERCKFLRLHCYKLETDGVGFDGEQVYMSKEFILMMWRRTLFLLDVLKRGYSFVFTDADVMWLRNPFPKLTTNPAVDLQISTDKFNGNENSPSNEINTGFYMIKSNNKTISLFQSWYDRRLNSTGLKEQDVLVNLIREGIFTSLDLNVRYLDTLFFSGFCQDSRDMRVVCTVHANCCRTISAKVEDLTVVINRWKRFGKGGNDTGFDGLVVNHVACSRSWRH